MTSKLEMITLITVTQNMITENYMMKMVTEKLIATIPMKTVMKFAQINISKLDTFMYQENRDHKE